MGRPLTPGFTTKRLPARGWAARALSSRPSRADVMYSSSRFLPAKQSDVVSPAGTGIVSSNFPLSGFHRVTRLPPQWSYPEHSLGIHGHAIRNAWLIIRHEIDYSPSVGNLPGRQGIIEGRRPSWWENRCSRFPVVRTPTQAIRDPDPRNDVS